MQDRPPTRTRSTRFGRFGRLLTASSLLASGLFAVGVAAAPAALADPSPAPAGSSQLITVGAPSSSSTTATVTAWQRGSDGIWRVAIGPVGGMVGGAGIGAASEGSERTPAGTFALTQSFGRQANPGTRMPYFQTDTSDWWDENPSSPTYNLHVRQSSSPGGASENLYNSGSVYDYVVNMDYNLARVPGAGSAFFLHVSDGTPTAGCVSVSRTTMAAILRWLDPAQHPYISIRVGPPWKAPTPSVPVGRADSMKATGARQITVAGWAFDPGSPSSAQVRVTVTGPAGTSSATVRTGIGRPDVARAYTWAGAGAGYRAVATAQGLGQNLVCVSIIPARSPSRPVSIVCHHLLVQNEFGRLDSLSVRGNVIIAVGWALNPTRREAVVAIRLYDTAARSTVIGDIRATQSRPDVARVYPGYSAGHGYRISFRALSKGTHTVCAVALPEYGSYSAATLGCKKIVVP
ncbi:L,D-peptidoglycan transpeptidase YkuD (ErfK/YbiS/YcfS/YnhG family) [Nakamurella sp. UYEF19]|uniref:L,D-transpeptidase family protein n=1 Tax=Nakamurella sp. UYEF19 TaxID=1756392 RepID=UPI0033997273